MPDYRLSEKAALDIEEIYQYTIENFGGEKANAYMLDLHGTFLRLGQQPQQGLQVD